MNWIDRILDLLHLAWFEVKQVILNLWACIRVPFWIYLITVIVLIGATIVCGMVVIGGVAIESTWTIFWGGLALLGFIVLVGLMLVPVILVVIVGIIRATYTRLGGGRP